MRKPPNNFTCIALYSKTAWNQAVFDLPEYPLFLEKRADDKQRTSIPYCLEGASHPAGSIFTDVKTFSFDCTIMKLRFSNIWPGKEHFKEDAPSW